MLLTVIILPINDVGYLQGYIIACTAVAQWLRCCATNRKVAGSIPASVSGFFIDIKSFRLHYGPGVVSSSNRNEYRCVRLTTLPTSCAVVMKSENLNFLEPCGPLQACNGTALPYIIACRKALKNAPGCINEILFYSNHQHVSAVVVAILRVMRTVIQIQL